MQAQTTLRYFDARGRAQFIRYYLSVRNVDFVDERIPIEPDFASWLAIRDDRSIAGPFRKLPLLSIDDQIVCETLVIANMLHEKFGDAAILSTTENLRHQQLMSSLFSDLTTQVAMLLWVEVMFEGLDFDTYVKRSFERHIRHITSIEETLNEWDWLARINTRPIMLVDCLLWEGLDVVCTVFGEHFRLESFPLLNEFYIRYRSGTVFSELLAAKPCQITARHDEANVIANVQKILTAS